MSGYSQFNTTVYRMYYKSGAFHYAFQSQTTIASVNLVIYSYTVFSGYLKIKTKHSCDQSKWRTLNTVSSD